jgi:nitrogen fixation/metabolism regulation signal transduction histidine kinase
MVYKRFSVGVVIRIGLILANVVCLSFIFARTELFFSQLILLIFLALQVYNLIHFVMQTNRDLSKFLLAIRHHDYSSGFINLDNTTPTFQELSHHFQSVIDSYREVEARRESQFQYFKLIIEHVQVGIVSLNSNNEVVLINNAAEQLLKVRHILNWGHLQEKRAPFTDTADKLLRGGSGLAEVVIEGEKRQFSVGVNHILQMGEPYRIITFSDIKNEIEGKEIEAWHKLIRILTHEIMNSVTPVVSLTETMLMILEDENGHQKSLSAITEENIADICFSLKTIQKRSGGILHFLNDYRQLTRIPVPRVEQVKVAALFESVARLMQGEISKRNVKLVARPRSQELTVRADARLLEQVLINLLTNSLQALEGTQHPEIELAAYTKENRLILEVSDNGKGIDADKLGKIFIPFYSTKAEGSGIGLPVSKQIMLAHGGSIKVHSQKGTGTSFQLQFPQG